MVYLTVTPDVRVLMQSEKWRESGQANAYRGKSDQQVAPVYWRANP